MNNFCRYFNTMSLLRFIHILNGILFVCTIWHWPMNYLLCFCFNFMVKLIGLFFLHYDLGYEKVFFVQVFCVEWFCCITIAAFDTSRLVCYLESQQQNVIKVTGLETEMWPSISEPLVSGSLFLLCSPALEQFGSSLCFSLESLALISHQRTWLEFYIMCCISKSKPSQLVA